ncbi:MAG: class I SAM-dependent methyltransferase [Deltaproteobacteria bacterium]|nr:class I SAM-dependent methyltransferase [Deltaproteobacteria bacterium]
MSGISAEVFDVARQLESASPGLALMMQLRARLFDEMVVAAGRRGFEQVVLVSCGFERRRSRSSTVQPVRTIKVEHPAVFEAFARRSGFSRHTCVPADDFQQETWQALEDRGFSPRVHKTLLILQGLSLWGGPTALDYWLDRLAEQDRVGGEMVLNLLDSTSAAHAQHAGDELVGPMVSPEVGIRFGADGARVLDQIAARSLHLRRLFDSHDLQRRHFGVEDLLVSELYVWVGASADTPRPTAQPRSEAATPTTRVAEYRTFRPSLRPEVEVAAASAQLTLPVSELRNVGLELTPRDLAIASLFDGVRNLAEITERMDDSSCEGDGTVWNLVHRIRSHGFLVSAGDELYRAGLEAVERGAGDAAQVAFLEAIRRDRRHLGALRELGFTALERGDAALARRVARLLVPLGANAAARHLRELLCSREGTVLIARDGPLTVAMGQAGSREEARGWASGARNALEAGTRFLGVQFTGAVVVDLRSDRVGIPTTVVSDAEPYTLIRLSRPQCSPALLMHELTHVLAMCGSPWLSEGLAVWVQRRVVPGICFPDDRLEVASRSSSTLAARLQPEGKQAAQHARLDRAAYREAASFVDWFG